MIAIHGHQNKFFLTGSTQSHNRHGDLYRPLESFRIRFLLICLVCGVKRVTGYSAEIFARSKESLKWSENNGEGMKTIFNYS